MGGKKSLKEILGVLGRAGLQEHVHPNTLKAGIENSEEIFNVVRKKTYKWVQGIGDDFIPDTDLYNAVGAIYPALPREQQDAALRAVLSQLDCVNTRYVQINHTPYIREPLLHADLWVVRVVYWSGLGEGEAKIAKHGDFDDFQSSLMSANGMFRRDKVNSDFCVAYAALSSDMFKHSQEYARAAHQGFLERVVKGAVNMRFGRAEDEEAVQKGRARLVELLPEITHPMIDKYLAEKSWADKAKFG